MIAELRSGTVLLDDQEVGELQDGQFILDRVTPGKHTLQIKRPPLRSGALLRCGAWHIAGAGGIHLHQRTACGGRRQQWEPSAPHSQQWTAQVNDERRTPEDATSEGIELTGFQPGALELTLGEGKKLRKLAGTFPASPALNRVPQDRRKHRDHPGLHRRKAAFEFSSTIAKPNAAPKKASCACRPSAK
ncbi:MAG: hypothetical protein WDO18_04575 [Acidobacteriota bacterium]